MDPGLIVRGFVLGLAVAAAIGPMAILCIRRTLVRGHLAGLSTGLGIATADGMYALLAAFGVTMIAEFLVGQREWLELGGGAFLCYLGLRIAATTPAQDAGTATDARDIGSWFLTAFLLTLANPMTIISFGALFAGLGLVSAASYVSGGLLVTGVFLGSMSWWMCLTTGVRSVGHRLSAPVLGWVNRLSGIAILCFGILAMLSVLV